MSRFLLLRLLALFALLLFVFSCESEVDKERARVEKGKEIAIENSICKEEKFDSIKRSSEKIQMELDNIHKEYANEIKAALAGDIVAIAKLDTIQAHILGKTVEEFREMIDENKRMMEKMVLFDVKKIDIDSFHIACKKDSACRKRVYESSKKTLKACEEDSLCNKKTAVIEDMRLYMRRYK